MLVRFFRKAGHNFFEFQTNFSSHTVCVDFWINSGTCPPFCVPVLMNTWEPLPDSRYLKVTETELSYAIECPTCLGYFSSKGSFRKVGPYHVRIGLDKTGFYQFLHNYFKEVK